MRSKYTDLIKTSYKLGIGNVLSVARYRLNTFSGLYKIKFKPYFFELKDEFYLASNFNQEITLNIPKSIYESLLDEANDILSGKFRYYSFHTHFVGYPPDWFINPFNGIHAPDSKIHWSEIRAFGKVGDIKNVWELSRFDWIYTLCRAYIYTNDLKFIDGLNFLLRDWHNKNPLNLGANWYCGQEASIRLFALLNCSLVLGIYSNPTTSLLESIIAHLKRIYPTLHYAIAQKNNHGTSESAALYIGGNWLAINGRNNYEKRLGRKFSRMGKKKLELSILELFDSDGTFSQYSVNYHRVALDTACFAEIWRRKFDLEPFSKPFYNKTENASKWLRYFTDLITGKGLNLGSNDGALLLKAHSCDYRDFRPSCQLSSLLFENSYYFNREGIWNEPIHLFKLVNFSNPVDKVPQKVNRVLENNYVMCAAGSSWACFRLPSFKFRPKQMDVFHFDFTINGTNLLCDAGSYSYNNEGLIVKRPFKSTKAHNTVFFGNEQMTQLGNFLSGSWLSIREFSGVEYLENNIYSMSASCVDYAGNFHRRQIIWGEKKWIIKDEIEPSSSSVNPELYFNLNALDIEVENKRIRVFIQNYSVDLIFSVPIIVEKAEISEYYMEKHEINLIKATFTSDMQIITEIIIS
ncbi:MAG: heparinase II/III-family protein [Bacteroidia bacterium]|nr:heparinase II/III-family protein [Bacteroidia bacterium]